MQSSPVIPVWKPVAFTPLEVIQKLKMQIPEYANETISYAGRLDPMAEGVLVLLMGEENKKRKEYEDLVKVYDAEIVLGLKTDSFDGMGLVTGVSSQGVSREKIESTLMGMVGGFDQAYPPYSSRTVGGKPLYWWVRHNKLGEIKIPSKNVEIFSISDCEFENVSSGKMVEVLSPKIKSISGDFRQEEILHEWKVFAGENKDTQFVKISFEIAVSSGTYIRAIAQDLGERLGTGAFLFSLVRTKVGKFSKDQCVIINT